jgi:translation initiation factor 3 subunit A
MDTNKLVQMQVEQIKEREQELSERLRLTHRKTVHLKRAYRREEAPLLLLPARATQRPTISRPTE